jgi:hypothetical protein
MLKVHQNAPTSMLKSENFSGVIPPNPRIKRGGEGLGRVGKGGNRCLAHPKIIPWRPLCYFTSPEYTKVQLKQSLFHIFCKVISSEHPCSGEGYHTRVLNPSHGHGRSPALRFRSPSCRARLSLPLLSDPPLKFLTNRALLIQ